MNRSLIYYFLLVTSVFSFSIQSISMGTLDSLVEKLQIENIDDTTRANIFLQMSHEYFEMNNYVSALSYADKAENIYIEYDLSLKEAQVHLFKGELFTEVNDYENSIINYKKAQEVYESSNYLHELNEINIRLSEVNARLGNFNKSKILINSAFQYFKNKKDEQLLKQVYYQYAILYGLLNSLDSALIYLEKSKKILTTSKEKNYSELGGIYNNIGAIYSKKNDYKKALVSYNEAIKVFERGGNRKGIGVSISNIAFLYHKSGELDKAEKYYVQSSNILKKEGDILYLSTIYTNWSDLYEEVKDFESAYKMQVKYMELEDSLAGVEVMTRIAELEKQYELKKKNQELEYLEKENTIKRNRQYLLLAIIILILIVAFLVYRNMKVNIKNSQLKEQILKNEKILLKEELDYKGKEVEDLALRIIEKNKFLEGLKDEVGKIDGVGENKEKIKSVSSHIRENLYIDQDRKDFELQLDEIHKSFLFKLDKAYPSLTKSEKRLATLLVMGMSTKDIASILNLSIAGVKTSRYRLRKKIDLDSKIDLATHFQNM